MEKENVNPSKEGFLVTKIKLTSWPSDVTLQQKFCPCLLIYGNYTRIS
jgi:hypothetical protein